MISFLLNDKPVHLEKARPNLTVLEFLREQQNLTGTKEGCASGDCGACTVVLVEYDSTSDKLEYRSINSCITFIPTLHGKQLITVEYLADDANLHPVQQAMVKHHGSQCGFCTPGFVMSIFAQYQQKQAVNKSEVETALSGNLCRCTGYRPIIDAAIEACSQYEPDKFAQQEPNTVSTLQTLKSKGDISGIFVPDSIVELGNIRLKNPDATLVAGGTDIALESTQQYQDFDSVIYLGNVQELKRIEEQANGLLIGAAVTYQKMQTSLLNHFPELEELVSRLGSLPVRNQGTMGGNVANASPIGDTPPFLIALGASINLDDGITQRTVPARDFFVGYRKTQMYSHEWIDSVFIPYKKPDTQLRAYKVSKRYEDDISTLCCVFSLRLKDGLIESITCGFGGVAATPVYLEQLELELVGLKWSEQTTFQKGGSIINKAFSPISDVRASADYRKKLLGNLWQRFWLETNAIPSNFISRVS